MGGPRSVGRSDKALEFCCICSFGSMVVAVTVITSGTIRCAHELSSRNYLLAEDLFAFAVESAYFRSILDS